jgi:hypothetical protein
MSWLKDYFTKTPGTFLSGGINSTYRLAYMNQASENIPKPDTYYRHGIYIGHDTGII